MVCDTVEPEIFLNPTSGKADTTVTVTGTGFGRRNEVTVYFDDVGLASTTTGSNGSFDTEFIVPTEYEAGIYNVEAEDEDENTDKAKFTVTVAPPPAPAPAPPPAPSPPPSASTATISPKNGPVGTQLNQ